MKKDFRAFVAVKNIFQALVARKIEKSRNLLVRDCVLISKDYQ